MLREYSDQVTGDAAFCKMIPSLALSLFSTAILYSLY